MGLEPITAVLETNILHSNCPPKFENMISAYLPLNPKHPFENKSSMYRNKLKTHELFRIAY
jgi:hypothetical protein